MILIAIAGYLGNGPKLDGAIARCSAAYADQNELTVSDLSDAVAQGEIRVHRGIGTG